MDTEQIHEAWWSYIEDMLNPRTTAFPLELPYLISEPHCATCLHWFLIDEQGLNHLAVTSSPNEYDKIINDLSGKRFGVNKEYDKICKEYDKIINNLSGKRFEAYKEKGEVIDAYQDYRFYGWCKPFPPIQRSGYSVISLRSLFSFLSRNIPEKVSEYDFPLMPHDCSCGEWNEDHWVAEFISKYRPKAQKDDREKR